MRPSLVYRTPGNDKSIGKFEVRSSVKTTLIMRNTANPRRITLAHLQDADELTTRAVAEEALFLDTLEAQTANPERTMLEDAPAG